MRPQTLNPPFAAVFSEELEAIAAHYGLPFSHLQASANPLLPWLEQYWEMVFATESFELITAGNGRVFAIKVADLALESGLSERTVAIFQRCCDAFPEAILGIKLCFSANGPGMPTIYVRTKTDTATGLGFLKKHLSASEISALQKALQHNQTLYGLGFSEKEGNLYVKTYTIEDVENPEQQKVPGFVSHRLYRENCSREHKVYLPEVPLAEFQPEDETMQQLRDFLLYQMHYSQAGHIGLLYENGLPKEYKIYVERAGGIPTDFAAR